MMSSILSVSNLSKSYNNIFALNFLSFECNKGEIVSVVGSSGSGKSTLLKLIAGLEIPDNGKIVLKDTVINDESVFVEPEKRDCDIVFQDFSLFPNLTVDENISFGKNASNNKSMINKLVSLANISDTLSRYPHQISGGQQQRVALVRALANNPSLLLMDEPLSHLDSALKEKVRSELLSILKKLDMTVLIVTHDAEDALTISDKTIVLNQGQLEQVDTPRNIYKFPKSEYVAQLFGKTNILPLELIPRSKHSFTQKSSDNKMVSVRPHQLIIESDTNSSLPKIKGQITNIFNYGHGYNVEVKYKDLFFVAEIKNGFDLKIGETVTFCIELD